MRRDKNDVQWQNCKDIVFNLDKSQCLLCQCLTVSESIVFQKSNPENVLKIDPAHYKAVSQRQDLMYDPNNVYCLCRSHHERMDNNRHPITNETCTKEVTESFWQRVIAKRQENVHGKKLEKLPEFFYDLD